MKRREKLPSIRLQKKGSLPMNFRYANVENRGQFRIYTTERGWTVIELIGQDDCISFENRDDAIAYISSASNTQIPLDEQLQIAHATDEDKFYYPTEG